MTYDFHIHIDDQSPEALVLESIMNSNRVSPEEAIRRALRHPALASRTPADEMIGAFSSPEDAAIMDEAMQYVHELRETDHLRDFGL